jgi:uncharacterized protein YaaW (UPF0174 family)
MIKYREDSELFSVLENASQDDLAILVDIITDNGQGRVSLDDEVMKQLISAKNAGNMQQKHLLTLAGEIQLFGGNSIVSLFRGSGVEYREIVCDVADHLGANFKDTQDIAQIEGAILMKVVEKSLEKMTEEEKKKFFDQFGINYTVAAGPAAMAALQLAIKAGGFASFQIAVTVANAVAKAVIGRGLALGGNVALTRTIGVFAGPIGWAITAIWSAFDLAAPAYRVTVPCAIQLASMRQKALLHQCPECKAAIAGGMKFCSECGHKIS